MLTRDVIVVGAGVSGLTLAGELGRAHAVTLVDRLPAVGGVLGYEHPLVEELNQVVRDRQVEVVLGTTALRWQDHRLLVAGPRGIEWIPSGCLAFCGGSRPSTAAELGVGGDRPAGVYSATVAIHLMEAQVRLANTAVVVGGSDWARRAAHDLLRQCTRVIGVFEEEEEPPFGDDRWRGWRLLEIHGAARVSHVVLGHSHYRQRIACDAVILGSHLKPLRNVDGAIFDARDVTYVQPQGDVITATEVERTARQAVSQMLAGIGGQR